MNLTQRLDRLAAALIAAPPAGGPARRIASDYASGGSGKGGGRRVRTKAGEKRYGLPIGTPLGQTGSRRKNDAATQASYNTFMSAKTPAELNKAASWMSSDDLKRAGEALFSFASKNERDEAARMSLVKELAARGIDPHAVGYKGGPVVLNPNPKKDPHVQAAERRNAAARRAARARQQVGERSRRERERDQRERERAAKAKTEQQAAEEDVKFRQQAGEALAKGLATNQQLREAWRNRRKPRPSSVTAAFNPRQPRDRLGRWVEMGDLVHFDLGGNKKSAGVITGTDDQGRFQIKDQKTGDIHLANGDQIEVVKAQATLNAPDQAETPAAPAVDTPLPPLDERELAAHIQGVERSIEAAKEAGLETDKAFSQDGRGEVWAPHRAKRHNEIVDEMWAKAANVPNEGKVLFSGGLGGAGKTTTLGNPQTGIDQSQYLTINPDDIKEILAEKGMIPDVPDSEVPLSPMEKVALIHEESSHIANLLAQRAYAEKKNVTWDITMASEGSVAKRIAEMKRNGYGEMKAVFVDIPVEKSVERAMGRYQRGMEQYRNGKGAGGRYVPPSVIRKNVSDSFSSANRKNFETLRDQFDDWQVWDNSVDGREPRMVYSKSSPDLDRLTDEARAGLTDNDRTREAVVAR